MDERPIQTLAHQLIARHGDHALEYVDSCPVDALDRDDEQPGCLMCRLFDVILVWQMDAAQQARD